MVLGQLGSLNFANLVTCGHSLLFFSKSLTGKYRCRYNSHKHKCTNYSSNYLTASDILEYKAFTLQQTVGTAV